MAIAVADASRLEPPTVAVPKLHIRSMQTGLGEIYFVHNISAWFDIRD